MIKQLFTILTNINFEEIDYSDTDSFSSKIAMKTRHFDHEQFLTSRHSTRLFVMGLDSSCLLSLLSLVRSIENSSVVTYSIWINLSSKRPRRRIPTLLMIHLPQVDLTG